MDSEGGSDSVGRVVGITLGVTALIICLALLALCCSYRDPRQEQGYVTQPRVGDQLPPGVLGQQYPPQIQQYPYVIQQQFQQYPLPGPQPFLPYQPYVQYYQPTQEYRLPPGMPGQQYPPQMQQLPQPGQQQPYQPYPQYDQEPQTYTPSRGPVSSIPTPAPSSAPASPPLGP